MATQPPVDPEGDSRTENAIREINTRLEHLARALEGSTQDDARLKADQLGCDQQELEVHKEQLEIDRQQFGINARQLRVSSRLMILTLVLALIGAVQSYFSLLGAKAAKQAAVAAKQAADTDSDSLIISSGNFDRTMRQIIPQTAAQLASAKAAANALKIAQDQIELDQRAWIGLSTFKAELDPRNDLAHPAPLLYYFAVSTLLNSGRTPATHATAIMGIFFKKHSYTLSKSDEDWLERKAAAIFAGTESPQCFKSPEHLGETDCRSSTIDASVTFQLIDFIVILPNLPITYTHPERWPEKRIPSDRRIDPKILNDVVLFGEVKYRDVAPKTPPRLTKFCAQRPELQDAVFTACPIFNDMR